MDNITVWLILGVMSILFGVSSRIAAYKPKSYFYWFFEGWRDVVSYFTTFIIGYFFVTIRWPVIEQTGILSISDFVLSTAFLVGILGWFPYLIKNITEGINVIIKKILDK